MTTEDPNAKPRFVCFQGPRRVVTGVKGDVAVAAKAATDHQPDQPVSIFDLATGRAIDLDLRGSEAEVRARYEDDLDKVARRGRPKLGVVAREVTLLPRHWEWLANQPGGASVTLRKLIDTARKAPGEAGDLRARTNAAYHFMVAMAGDFPGFEEASRALFAADLQGLQDRIALWPTDVRQEIVRFLEI